MISDWGNMGPLDRLFVVWAFTIQLILIIHFAVRRPLMQSYTLKFGWIVYALCIPAVIISVILLRGGKTWSFWLGGFLFVLFAAFGYWVDFIAKISFRSPPVPRILFPYATLYLGTMMFYWWPVGQLSRPMWFISAVLFVISTVLNVTSH